MSPTLVSSRKHPLKLTAQGLGLRGLESLESGNFTVEGRGFYSIGFGVQGLGGRLMRR